MRRLVQEYSNYHTTIRILVGIIAYQYRFNGLRTHRKSFILCRLELLRKCSCFGIWSALNFVARVGALSDLAAKGTRYWRHLGRPRRL